MKTINSILILNILLLAVFPLVSGVGEFTYCCEKTVDGDWCIPSSDKNYCDQSVYDSGTGAKYRVVPTSCESTSYCKTGTCINSQEGTCMENTPERVCNDEGGVWNSEAPEDIPQCQLGCCLVGDQAAFVTQTRCKRLSSLYGLETNFNTGISNEVACIASATSEVKGACVFEKEFETTCKLTSKRECQNLEESSSDLTGVEFHEGFLCSATELATNCGPSKETTCVDGRDEVYFIDTCGNLANIYDASQIDDESYWAEITEPSCGSGSNADSSTCGNCDYLLGSTCKAYKRGEDKVKPNDGDYICRDLSCSYDSGDDGKEEEYQHGETWCADSKGTSQIEVDGSEVIVSGENLPGSRHFRMLCYNDEVTVEPCADFRQEVCLESSVNDFSTAACRVNMWQDCVAQDNEKDCENLDRRDCEWIPGDRFDGEKRKEIDEKGSCVPANAPGLDFWSSEGDSESLCALASDQCVVKFEKKYTGGGFDPTPEWECKDNCECLGLRKGDSPSKANAEESEWAENKNTMCLALGDCGSIVNYLDIEGYHNESSLTVESA